ncbi:MAG TPA: hypothetical protein DCY74_01525 [Clostridiales bacterium]|nr:hypothetical protein [Clostridiales bacterium]
MRKTILFLLILPLLFSITACQKDTDGKINNQSAWDFPLDVQLTAENAGRVYREAWVKTQARTERDYTTTVTLTDDNYLYDYTAFVEEHRVYTDIGGKNMAVSLNGSMSDYYGNVSPFMFFYEEGYAYTNHYAETYYKAPCTSEDIEVLLGYDYVLDSAGDYQVYAGKRNADGTYTITYSEPDDVLMKNLSEKMGTNTPTSLSAKGFSGICTITEDGFVSSDVLTIKGTYLTYNDDAYMRTLIYDFKENTSSISYNPIVKPSLIKTVGLESLTAVHYLNNSYYPLKDFEALSIDLKSEIKASILKKNASLVTEMSLLRETVDDKIHATMSASKTMTEGEKILQSDIYVEEYENELIKVNENGTKNEFTVSESSYKSTFIDYYNIYGSFLNKLTAAKMMVNDNEILIEYSLDDEAAFFLADAYAVEIFGDELKGLVYEDEDTVLEYQSGTMVLDKNTKAVKSHTLHILGTFPTSEGDLILDTTFTLTVKGTSNATVSALMDKSAS